VGFLINNQSLCQGIAKDRTTRWVRETLKKHLPQGHDFEVSWCLVACGVLGITVRKQDLPAPETLPNSVVFALLGLLRERNLLEVPLSYWKWRTQLKKLGIFSEAWLPFYEAVRRKWTNDKKMVSAVNSNPTLSSMLKRSVTFLDDDIFQATTINLKKRTFKKAKAGKKKPISWWTNIPTAGLDYS